MINIISPNEVNVEGRMLVARKVYIGPNGVQYNLYDMLMSMPFVTKYRFKEERNYFQVDREVGAAINEFINNGFADMPMEEYLYRLFGDAR